MRVRVKSDAHSHSHASDLTYPPAVRHIHVKTYFGGIGSQILGENKVSILNVYNSQVMAKICIFGIDSTVCKDDKIFKSGLFYIRWHTI
jgi:hypothetical protein